MRPGGQGWGKREKRKEERRGEERRVAASRHEVDVLFNVDRDAVCTVALVQRPAIFTVSVAAVLPSVKHPIITELDMNFCEYAPSVMIHACSARRTRVYILRERDKAHADTEKREERALSTLVQQPNGYIDDEGRIHCAARGFRLVFGHATEE
ncbi:hypothetical protein K0M31_010891 [Melipona bicolor]|uniref:Uncharacterized protein n=1 Tax=Melipona bicolor TaxID=60889 RepID=A0AA40KI22_9HYME|nr:hypothetical protein K0M31_010891 [Melipona bicolor]